MRIITFCMAVTLWFMMATMVFAQEDRVQTKIETLKSSKEQIIEDEKGALKDEVESITKRLEDGAISSEEATRLKKEVAEKRARNIENKLAIVDNKIALMERNGNDTLVNENVKFSIDLFQNKSIVTFGTEDERKYDLRTTSDLVLAIGFNNVITEGQSLSDSPYKIAGSRFFELGIAFKTRVFKNTNWLRVKYGVSFQFNGLKPTDNRYFVDTGAQTELQVHPQDLDKSKFRMDNVVVPVHFEFGPSRKIEKDDYFRYNTWHQIKVGIGGYAGVNMATKQKLKFSLDGEDVKQKLKSDYNTNNFVYGLSAYIGWHGVAVYGKYDLNTIFKDNPIKQRNVSLGLRFDMD